MWEVFKEGRRTKIKACQAFFFGGGIYRSIFLYLIEDHILNSAWAYINNEQKD